MARDSIMNPNMQATNEKFVLTVVDDYNETSPVLIFLEFEEKTVVLSRMGQALYMAARAINTQGEERSKVLKDFGINENDLEVLSSQYVDTSVLTNAISNPGSKDTFTLVKFGKDIGFLEIGTYIDIRIPDALETSASWVDWFGKMFGIIDLSNSCKKACPDLSQRCCVM